jgi:DNA mismatch repair ATPase MutS
MARLAGVHRDVITRSRALLAEFEGNFSSTRHSEARASSRTRAQEQLLLFHDPSDNVLKEIRELDLESTTPLDALRAIAEWKKRLGPDEP